MTIKIEIECDALSCHNSAEIADTYDADIEHAGYHVDPVYEGYHYCSKCWPGVKEEFEEES